MSACAEPGDGAEPDLQADGNSASGESGLQVIWGEAHMGIPGSTLFSQPSKATALRDALRNALR